MRRGSLSTRLSAAIPEDVHLTYSYPDHSRIITPTELIKHNAAHSVFSANPTSDTVAAINRDSAGKHYPLSLRSPRGAATTRHNFKAGKFSSFRTGTALGALMSRQSLGHARSNKQGGGGGGRGRGGGVTRPNAVVSPDGSFPPQAGGGGVRASVRPSVRLNER